MSPKVIDIITSDTIKVFGLNDEYLFNLKVDNGIAYLQKRFQQEIEIAEALKSNPKFWLWWRELWAERDRKLLSMCARQAGFIQYSFPIRNSKQKGLSFIPYCDGSQFYERYHKPEKIVFYPNYVLINECMGSDKFTLSINE